MKKIFIIFVITMFCFAAHAAVIDIVDLGNGTYNVFSDGTPYGNSMSREAVEKAAKRLEKGGNSINWKKSSNTSVNSGGPKASINSNSKNLPATTPKPGSNLPATTTGGGGNIPPKSTPKPKATTGGGASAVAKVGGVLSVASGAYMLYDSTKAKEEKTTWGDIGEGAAAGAAIGSGLIALNAIPLAGTVAYAVAIAAFTVSGASGAGAKMFAETDCDYDPVRQTQVCCNVSKLTNLKGVYANIGDKMFWQFPYVRTCLQGGKPYESNWFKARFLDDKWSDGVETYCAGWVAPEAGDMKINLFADTNNICWEWECAEERMTRQGNTCVPNEIFGDEQEAATVIADAYKPGDPCPHSDLPENATAGIYIKGGRNGANALTCAATECVDGAYMVKNDDCVSQGWCKIGTEPDTCKDKGTLLPIDIELDLDEDENIAIDNQSLMDAIKDTQLKISAMDAPDNCARKVAGYVMFEGSCITTAQQRTILDERARAAEAARQATRRRAAENISSAFKNIEDLSAQFKVSKWKNEEGKFNTARLVSDSVAGVVLGTAGGLITSSVIKKNQVKTGFEDIQCVIGGQNVAEYGDQFTVGVQ